MRSRRLVTSVVLAQLAAGSVGAQGCDMLLRDGVFNTFSRTSGRYAYDEWHQAWCNGTIRSESSGGATSVKLDLVVKAIPIGLGVDDARQFQSYYQQQFCGNADRTRVNLTQFAAAQKTADPALVSAYVSCKEVEGRGLDARFLPTVDNKAFTITLRYNRAYDVQGNRPPRITAVTFAPSGIVRACRGTITYPLSRPIDLTENTQSLQCERVSNDPVQVTITTDAGAFTRELPSTLPPPSDLERVLGVLPSGTILPLGSPTPLPAGWRACDGQGGTPNLLGRFPLGAQSDYGTGDDGMLTIPALSVRTTANHFAGARDNIPNLGPREHEGWGRFHPVTSEGSTAAKEVGPVMPPFTRIYYACKM